MVQSRARFNEIPKKLRKALVESGLGRFNEVPEKVPKALVESRARFNEVAELAYRFNEVLEEGSGGIWWRVGPGSTRFRKRFWRRFWKVLVRPSSTRI